MESYTIISFISASIVLTLMPGPDILYVIMESLTKGRKTGIIISLGLVSGLVIHTLLAAFGIGIIFKQSNLVFMIFKMIGAAYLLHLAYQSFKEEANNANDQNHSTVVRSNFALWKRGFFMNVLNPKVSLFFLFFLPQFIDNNGANVSNKMILLGLIFMIQAAIIFSLVSILASKFNRVIMNAKFGQYAIWIKTIVLIALAIGLLLSTN